MKKILVFAVLSLATGTPSVAQSYNPDFGSGNVLAAPPAPAVNGAFESRAQAPASRARKHHGRECGRDLIAFHRSVCLGAR